MLCATEAPGTWRTPDGRYELSRIGDEGSWAVWAAQDLTQGAGRLAVRYYRLAFRGNLVLLFNEQNGNRHVVGADGECDCGLGYRRRSECVHVRLARAAVECEGVSVSDSRAEPIHGRPIQRGESRE